VEWNNWGHGRVALHVDLHNSRALWARHRPQKARGGQARQVIYPIDAWDQGMARGGQPVTLSGNQTDTENDVASGHLGEGNGIKPVQEDLCGPVPACRGR
jgi:hypothetical protein